MKTMLTEAEKDLNPQLEAQVGDKVEQKDILYPVIPADFVGGEADNILRNSNSPHYANNRINVMDGDSLVKTYSGDRDGTNWKKHAELYAQLNGYTLAAYDPTLKEKAELGAEPQEEEPAPVEPKRKPAKKVTKKSKK